MRNENWKGIFERETYSITNPPAPGSAANNPLAFLNNAGAGPGGKTTIKVKITDYGFHDNDGIAAEWVDEDGKNYAHEWQASELGDELAWQNFCANAYVDANAQAVCDMTDFLGYKPGELVPPRELWQTLAADQREAVVRGLIEQLKSETEWFTCLEHIDEGKPRCRVQCPFCEII